jgi:hypothetical protein
MRPDEVEDEVLKSLMYIENGIEVLRQHQERLQKESKSANMLNMQSTYSSIGNEIRSIRSLIQGRRDLAQLRDIASYGT